MTDECEVFPDWAIEDAALEIGIARAFEKLQSIDWLATIGQPSGSDRAPDILVPVSYAMFKFLVKDVADDPDIWARFLEEALNETINRYS